MTAASAAASIANAAAAAAQAPAPIIIRMHPRRHLRYAPMVFAAAFGMCACSSQPPAPDWQITARDALERSVSAYLSGDARIEAREFARATGAIARTGRGDLLARAELARCAAQVASLVVQECRGFTQLAPDAAPAERAYAAFLSGQVAAVDVALLPPQYRGFATAVAAAQPAALVGIGDPVSTLVAAGVLFRQAQASPEVAEIAVQTASAQGWRRPLLAWLGVQAQRAQQAGASAEVQRLQRRMAVVLQGGVLSAP